MAAAHVLLGIPDDAAGEGVPGVPDLKHLVVVIALEHQPFAHVPGNRLRAIADAHFFGGARMQPVKHVNNKIKRRMQDHLFVINVLFSTKTGDKLTETCRFVHAITRRVLLFCSAYAMF